MKNKNGKSSCGCIVCLAILGVAFLFVRSCASGISAARQYTAENRSEAATTNTPPTSTIKPKVDPLAEPEPIVAELMFKKCLRDYLHDPNSYTPGDIRHGKHRDGYVFIQDFRARNAFGAMIKQSAGLLASTNSGKIAWTFYTPEQTPTLIREVMQHKANTDPKIRAFKESVDEARQRLNLD